MSPANAAPVRIYVASNGSDTATGTLRQPYTSVYKAQETARKYAGKNPVEVILRSGTHYLPDTLTLTAADSGTKGAPVVYSAYPGETVTISGGVRLHLEWTPYRDGIMKAHVPAKFTTDQLFVNGERQQMARYPNYNPNERIFNGYAADAISPERVRRWADPTGGFLHAMHEAEWGGFSYRITGKDTQGNLQYEGGWQNNRPARMHSQHRFVENIFEELDAPGEWFLDTKSSTLYFYPPSGLDLAHATIEGVRLKHLVEFKGTQQAPVRYVTLKGLTFRHTLRTFMENREPLVRSDWTTYRGGAIFVNGAEDCTVQECLLDQVGGNAIFLNNYNRRIAVRSCHITRAGGNGVAFVGDRDAARVPRDWQDHSQSLANLDRTPGPKTDNYPSDCLVDDCLIHETGRIEKQTAPVQIELSKQITIRHCSLYDVPRAGINIGDGCWGGHLIEFCDIFDTVKETGDHGSFNSWGRDRFWNLPGLNLNDATLWETQKTIPLLDAVNTVTLRNNRWRCDHGWDIDLDDGSTNYHIVNNLCLHGGIKNREGFFRVVENNIILNNGFHPHVWYDLSQDIFRHNIFYSAVYLPAGGMPARPWGQEMDYNLVHRDGITTPIHAAVLTVQSKRDSHSIVADALFIDPAHGDYRVKPDSPALKLGFVNFPMNQFGVQNPTLKAIARTPELPRFAATATDDPNAKQTTPLWGAQIRNIVGPGDRSAYGLPGEYGVLITDAPTESLAAKAGLHKDDVILAINGTPIKTVADLLKQRTTTAGKPRTLTIRRKQENVTVILSDKGQ